MLSLPISRSLKYLEFAKLGIILGQGRLVSSESKNLFSKKRNISGYESETAEIQDSIKQYTFRDNYDFLKDDIVHPDKVISKALPLRSEKGKSLYERDNEFIDYKRIRIKGGNGGDGMICFLQLKSNPFAGPSGGDGGNGGHVIFEASKDVRSLNRLQSSYTGQSGEKGMHKDMHGANSDHTIIKVPVGTLVKNANTGRLLADMSIESMKFLAARGGTGGKGNHYFLSNQNRHPRVAEIGAHGEEKLLILELKIIAEAGFVGFPNAGKSTLLSAVSRAKPKVASYPFTTLKPTIGIVQYDDMEQLAIADLPGIIKDAHKNKGLGIDFLKHVERCVCLFYVIDISVDYPYEQFKVLRYELEQYKKNLSNRPVAIVVNKMDIEGSEEKLETFKKCLYNDNLNHLRIIPISAKFGHNLTEYLVYFRELYDLHRYNQL